MVRSPASPRTCDARERRAHPGPISKKQSRAFAAHPAANEPQGATAFMTSFDLNGHAVSVHSPADTPLLWVIRDEMGLTGTKFGCGIGFCGACTVHVEGRATRSCITPVAAVAGAKITTIVNGCSVRH